MKNNTNINDFLEKYKQFENWAKNHFPHMIDMSYIERDYSVSEYKNQLIFFRLTRNLFTHNEMCDNVPITEMLISTDKLVESFDKMVKAIEDPAIARAISIDKMEFRTLEDKVQETMRIMKENDYSYIPILSKEKKIVGLFSEYSIFSIYGNYSIEENTTFKDILNYIRVLKNAKIVTNDKTTLECSNEFSKAVHKGQRLDVLFMTSDGTVDTPLLGMYTVWDVQKKNIK